MSEGPRLPAAAMAVMLGWPWGAIAETPHYPMDHDYLTPCERPDRTFYMGNNRKCEKGGLPFTACVFADRRYHGRFPTREDCAKAGGEPR